MFTDWISRTETKIAFSSTLDVRFDPINQGDSMESFVVSSTSPLLETNASDRG